MKKAQLRAAAQIILAKRALISKPIGGQGVLPGSRLLVWSEGDDPSHGLKYAVRVADQRALNCTRLASRRWRTFHAMDRILAMVPADEENMYEVFGFDAKKLISKFDEAWDELVKAGRSVGDQMPVFIPMDDVFAKNVGHSVANLKAALTASLSVCIRTADKLHKQFSASVGGIDIARNWARSLAARCAV